MASPSPLEQPLVKKGSGVSAIQATRWRHSVMKISVLTAAFFIGFAALLFWHKENTTDAQSSSKKVQYIDKGTKHGMIHYYTHTAPGCVNGANLAFYRGKTVQECAAICDADPRCKAFEYGVAYGGGGGHKAGDCTPNSASDSSGCDGSYHNLDLYVKTDYFYLPRSCVNGSNIEFYRGKTVQECAAICDADPRCKAFEYGVAYGGGGGYKAGDCALNSASDSSGCDGSYHNLDLYVKDENNGPPPATPPPSPSPPPATPPSPSPILHGTFTMKQRSTGRCAYPKGDYMFPNRARTYSCLYRNDQLWTLKRNSTYSDTYTIQSYWGKYLDARNNDDGWVYTASSREEPDWKYRHWFIKRVPRTKSTYTVQHFINHRYLDAYNGGGHFYMRNEYAMVTRPSQNDRSQQWILTRHR